MKHESKGAVLRSTFENRPLFKRKDVWVLTAATAAALVLFFLFSCFSGRADTAVIRSEGTQLMVVSLKEDAEFSPPGHEEVVIQVSKGRIRFLSSNCPDQICVRTGFISKPGQTAVCLPNRLSIEVLSPSEGTDTVDDVTGGAGR